MSQLDQTDVYAARDEIDATLVQAMLAEAGIDSQVVGGTLQGGAGELPMGWSVAPRVWVTAVNAANARTLIRAMEKSRREESENDEVWMCVECDEEVTVSFEICWNCQSPRVPVDS